MQTCAVAGLDRGHRLRRATPDDRLAAARRRLAAKQVDENRFPARPRRSLIDTHQRTAAPLPCPGQAGGQDGPCRFVLHSCQIAARSFRLRARQGIAATAPALDRIAAIHRIDQVPMDFAR